MEWSAIWISVKLAVTTTVILLIIGTPLAWHLAHTKRIWRGALNAIVALPFVLPPTVLGFYLLLWLGSHGWIGKLFNFLNLPLLPFSFAGLLIASIIYSLPFVVNPLQNAFELIGTNPIEAAATLRASPLDTFFSVILPLAKPGYITAAVMGFAHTLGEFGVVLMIGGNIPDKTRVISVAIYDHVEALEYTQAHQLSVLMLAVSFIVLLLLYQINKRKKI